MIHISITDSNAIAICSIRVKKGKFSVSLALAHCGALFHLGRQTQETPDDFPRAPILVEVETRYVDLDASIGPCATDNVEVVEKLAFVDTDNTHMRLQDGVAQSRHRHGSVPDDSMVGLDNMTVVSRVYGMLDQHNVVFSNRSVTLSFERTQQPRGFRGKHGSSKDSDESHIEKLHCSALVNRPAKTMMPKTPSKPIELMTKI